MDTSATRNLLLSFGPLDYQFDEFIGSSSKIEWKVLKYCGIIKLLRLYLKMVPFLPTK